MIQMYNLKIIKSGDVIEIYRIYNYNVLESKKDEGHKRIDKLLKKIDKDEGKQKGKQTKQAKQDRIKTLNKSKNNIIRLIRSNPDMQTFITLTFAKELDYKESKAKLNNFFTKLRKIYKNLKYLWVLEYGDKNNRLHYHVLCNIPIGTKLSSSKERKSQDHKMLEQEFNNKYWGYGFVDIRHLGKEDNTNVALYVSMYIVKSLKNLDLEGYRIYSYSKKTLTKPIETKEYTRKNIDELLREYANYRIKFSNNYDIGYTNYKGDHKGSVAYIELIKN